LIFSSQSFKIFLVEKTLKNINCPSDLPYWLGFNYFFKLGPARFKLFLNFFGSAKKAWNASLSDFSKIGLRLDLAESFLSFRSSFDFAKIEKGIKDKKIFVLTWMDGNYPERLRNIDDSPPVLYVKTGIKRSNFSKFFSLPSVAVVGTRKVTPYGVSVTKKFVSGMINKGICIVSGMANGVDGVAHRQTVVCGGRTIAVLGSGVDVLYPFESKDIYEKLISSDQGMVISEFPPGTKPNPQNFPFRNRIVSGLSDLVLVTEAAQRSGSLITARLAAEQGKDVFAVPGRIDMPFSQGTTFLIQRGARAVLSVDEILEQLV
jgi:DNA processing protein